MDSRGNILELLLRIRRGAGVGNYNRYTRMHGPASGTLAAIWYLNSGSLELSGTSVGSPTDAGQAGNTGSAQWFEAVDTALTFKAIVKSTDSVETVNTEFNFTPTSPKYIRKVFNTNPTLTNTNTTSQAQAVNYWLGETYEGNLSTFKDDGKGGTGGVSGSVASMCYGIVLPISTGDGTTKNGGDLRASSTKSLDAKTGWFFSQDLTSNTGSYDAQSMQKLFRLTSRDFSGAEIQKKVKISIQDIKRSPDTFNKYGSFSIVIRDIKDTDNAPIIYEQYNNCNLNPASDNYIAKKIGDSFATWSDTDRRYTNYGRYPNVSSFIRVEMNEDADRGATNPEYLPFGVQGHVRYLPFACSGSVAVTVSASLDPTTFNTPYSASQVALGGTVAAATTDGPMVGAAAFRGKSFVPTYATAITTSVGVEGGAIPAVLNGIVEFPKLRLRISSSEGTLMDPTDAYFGVDTTYNSVRFNESVWDVLRTRMDDISGFDPTTDRTEAAWWFSLDDVRNSAITASVSSPNYEALSGDMSVSYNAQSVWQSGSRVLGMSYTSHTASADATVVGPDSVSYINILDAGFDRFTTCLAGGFDGLNIVEPEPFNNTRDLASTYNERTSYAFNSVKVAIDSLRDPEVLEFNLATMPGITSNTLNDSLVKMCENRGDSLAIIDIPNVYTPSTEDTQSVQNRPGSVTTAVSNVRNNLQLNSSYGATYYPWVQIRDTINGATLYVPPSVAILGTLSYSQTAAALWFAPAGFTRGGLTANNAAGIPVVGLTQRLTSKERDTLYEANINPIAQFPAEGIVVFGQKTLQVTPSALDRINVRRLVIYLKKQISRMAATLLFDQNVQSTWNRFRGRVEPFLDNVKSGLGITDYRLILDESTTTPDLIDRNIMYAKIFVKPARAIEFIAIDFVITDSGASFED